MLEALNGSKPVKATDSSGVSAPAVFTLEHQQ